MSDTTGIEWTDATWNPIRGCSRVSEGCRNCYAERVAARFSGKGQPYEGVVRYRSQVSGLLYDDRSAAGSATGQWNGQVKFVAEHLADPLKWKRPRRIFVNSMSDLFHENVTDEWIDQIFAVMALCPQHTFQVLTKRPERMRKYINRRTEDGGLRTEGTAGLPAAAVAQSSVLSTQSWPLNNVWLGVSVEDRATADARIPELLKTPAAVRFVSYEPALGPVDFRAAALKGGDLQGIGIDWLICGGESGPGARPMHPDWARSAREQCQAAGVKFFFKQWGEWAEDWAVNDPDLKQVMSQLPCDAPVLTAAAMRKVGKKRAGRVLDGRTWDEMPAGALGS